MQVTFRKFNRSDSRRVSEILIKNFQRFKKTNGGQHSDEEVDSWSRVYEPNVLHHTRAKRRHYHVVELDGRIIGVGGWVNKHGKVEIRNISIDSEFQNNGMGKFLLLNLLMKIREEIGPTVVYVFPESIATGFYQRLGFGLDPVKKYFFLDLGSEQ